jgi:hypothetical protein
VVPLSLPHFANWDCGSSDLGGFGDGFVGDGEEGGGKGSCDPYLWDPCERTTSTGKGGLYTSRPSRLPRSSVRRQDGSLDSQRRARRQIDDLGAHRLGDNTFRQQVSQMHVCHRQGRVKGLGVGCIVKLGLRGSPSWHLDLDIPAAEAGSSRLRLNTRRLSGR